MIRASVILKFFLSKTSMLLQNAVKGWNSLCHRRSNLWAAELGICYSNVYGKISFAPLNFWKVYNNANKKNKIFIRTDVMYFPNDISK